MWHCRIQGTFGAALSQGTFGGKWSVIEIGFICSSRKKTIKS